VDVKVTVWQTFNSDSVEHEGDADWIK